MRIKNNKVIIEFNLWKGLVQLQRDLATFDNPTIEESHSNDSIIIRMGNKT